MFYLSIPYLIGVIYQSYCQELPLSIYLWPMVVDKAHVLSKSSVKLNDDARAVLEPLEELLVCLKFLLPALEHWHIGFPYHMG